MENFDTPKELTGVPVSELDEFDRHELLDRLHCINEMFYTLVATHPAAQLMEKPINDATTMLFNLYQTAGTLRFGDSGETVQKEE